MILQTKRRCFFAVLVGVAVSARSASSEDEPYIQERNLVYEEEHGVGLLLDTFRPRGSSNGLGIIDVISGAWHSDRGKIRDHKKAQVFRTLCGKGYTVFGIRPGSVSKFNAQEMLENLRRGVRWVKKHAAEYGVDPERLGLMGASAGGHLASLLAVTASADGPGRGTAVAAVAVFFPPTDFLDYGGQPIDVRGDRAFGAMVRRLAFGAGSGGDGGDGTRLEDLSEELILERVRAISPARLVSGKEPPFLLIHGDADPAVPLQQSEVFAAALEREGGSVELIVKKGGGHPWPTIYEEVAVIAAWFDGKLGVKKDPAVTAGKD